MTGLAGVVRPTKVAKSRDRGKSVVGTKQGRPCPRRAHAGLIRELALLVKDFPGDAPVYLALETSFGEKTLALGPEYRVKADSDFLAEARALLGEAALV